MVARYWILAAGVAIVLLFMVSNRSGFLEAFTSGSTFTMFGVDWCPHCVSAKPIFESLGSTVTIGDQSVSLRYVNPEKDKDAAGYEIDGFPTFYLEHAGRKTKYSGPRTADGFREFLASALA
jgi:glutaredoxin